jgi:hypothetical protein
MVRRLVQLSAAGALLGVLALRAETPSGNPERSRMEEAKRDLQTLPNLQRGTQPSTSLPEVAVPVPSFAANLAATARPDSKGTLQQNAPSQGWLLDALKADQERRDAAGRSNKWTSANAREQLTQREAENPLNSYVQQWLSPRDRELLLPARRDESNNGMRNAPESPSWRPRTEIDTKPMLTQAQSRAGERTRNPYLDPSSSSGFPATASAQSGSVSVPSNTTNFPLQALPSPAVSPNTGKPAKLDWTPPTAPVVNESRYFPQLRKF